MLRNTRGGAAAAEHAQTDQQRVPRNRGRGARARAPADQALEEADETVLAQSVHELAVYPGSLLDVYIKLDAKRSHSRPKPELFASAAFDAAEVLVQNDSGESVAMRSTDAFVFVCIMRAYYAVSDDEEPHRNNVESKLVARYQQCCTQAYQHFKATKVAFGTKSPTGEDVCNFSDITAPTEMGDADRCFFDSAKKTLVQLLNGAGTTAAMSQANVAEVVRQQFADLSAPGSVSSPLTPAQQDIIDDLYTRVLPRSAVFLRGFFGHLQNVHDRQSKYYADMRQENGLYITGEHVSTFYREAFLRLEEKINPNRTKSQLVLVSDSLLECAFHVTAQYRAVDKSHKPQYCELCTFRLPYFLVATDTLRLFNVLFQVIVEVENAQKGRKQQRTAVEPAESPPPSTEQGDVDPSVVSQNCLNSIQDQDIKNVILATEQAVKLGDFVSYVLLQQCFAHAAMLCAKEAVEMLEPGEWLYKEQQVALSMKDRMERLLKPECVRMYRISADHVGDYENAATSAFIALAPRLLGKSVVIPKDGAFSTFVRASANQYARSRFSQPLRVIDALIRGPSLLDHMHGSRNCSSTDIVTRLRPTPTQSLAGLFTAAIAVLPKITPDGVVDKSEFGHFTIAGASALVEIGGNVYDDPPASTSNEERDKRMQVASARKMKQIKEIVSRRTKKKERERKRSEEETRSKQRAPERPAAQEDLSTEDDDLQILDPPEVDDAAAQDVDGRQQPPVLHCPRRPTVEDYAPGGVGLDARTIRDLRDQMAGILSLPSPQGSHPLDFLQELRKKHQQTVYFAAALAVDDLYSQLQHRVQDACGLRNAVILINDALLSNDEIRLKASFPVLNLSTKTAQLVDVRALACKVWVFPAHVMINKIATYELAKAVENSHLLHKVLSDHAQPQSDTFENLVGMGFKFIVHAQFGTSVAAIESLTPQWYEAGKHVWCWTAPPVNHAAGESAAAAAAAAAPFVRTTYAYASFRTMPPLVAALDTCAAEVRKTGRTKKQDTAFADLPLNKLPHHAYPSTPSFAQCTDTAHADAIRHLLGAVEQSVKLREIRAQRGPRLPDSAYRAIQNAVEHVLLSLPSQRQRSERQAFFRALSFIKTNVDILQATPCPAAHKNALQCGLWESGCVDAEQENARESAITALLDATVPASAHANAHQVRAFYLDAKMATPLVVLYASTPAEIDEQTDEQAAADALFETLRSDDSKVKMTYTTLTPKKEDTASFSDVVSLPDRLVKRLGRETRDGPPNDLPDVRIDSARFRGDAAADAVRKVIAKDILRQDVDFDALGAILGNQSKKERAPDVSGLLLAQHAFTAVHAFFEPHVVNLMTSRAGLLNFPLPQYAAQAVCRTLNDCNDEGNDDSIMCASDSDDDENDTDAKEDLGDDRKEETDAEDESDGGERAAESPAAPRDESDGDEHVAEAPAAPLLTPADNAVQQQLSGLHVGANAKEMAEIAAEQQRAKMMEARLHLHRLLHETPKLLKTSGKSDKTLADRLGQLHHLMQQKGDHPDLPMFADRAMLYNVLGVMTTHPWNPQQIGVLCANQNNADSRSKKACDDIIRLCSSRTQNNTAPTPQASPQAAAAHHAAGPAPAAPTPQPAAPTPQPAAKPRGRKRKNKPAPIDTSPQKKRAAVANAPNQQAQNDVQADPPVETQAEKTTRLTAELSAAVKGLTTKQDTKTSEFLKLVDVDPSGNDGAASSWMQTRPERTFQWTAHDGRFAQEHLSSLWSELKDALWNACSDSLNESEG